MYRPVQLGDGHVFAGEHGSIEYACNGQPPEIIAVVEVRDQNLQRAFRVSLGKRNGFQDRIKQRTQIFATAPDIGRRCSLLRIGVENGKVELIFLGVKIDKQVVDFVEHLLRTRVGSVDLIDDNDGRQFGFESFAQYVAGLRQRTFAGVDQQHHSVDHFQCAFHFATKIAVAGRIHDVDLHVVIEDGRVLGQNGDAALALQFVRIHHALDVVLVGAKSATLLQHGVNQRGLAVVDVRDDGDVANAQTQSMVCPL